MKVTGKRNQLYGQTTFTNVAKPLQQERANKPVMLLEWWELELGYENVHKEMLDPERPVM